MRPSVILFVLVLGCRAQIQHGLEEPDAHLLQSVLQERGIRAEKVSSGGKTASWTLEVPADRAAEAVQVLADLGLPRSKPAGFKEVFGQPSLVPTPVEERALYLQALTGELTRTLETVDGVLSARVHVVLPVPARPGAPSGIPKASAIVRVRPGWMDRVQPQGEALRALLAASVEGLAVDQVTLLFNEAVTDVPMRAVPVAFPWFKWVSLGLGLLVALLSAVLAWLAARSRSKPMEATS